MSAATSGEGPKEGSNGRSNCEVLLIKGIFRRRHARDTHFSLDCPTRSNTLYLYREGAARNTSIAIVGNLQQPGSLEDADGKHCSCDPMNLEISNIGRLTVEQAWTFLAQNKEPRILPVVRRMPTQGAGRRQQDRKLNYSRPTDRPTVGIFTHIHSTEVATLSCAYPRRIHVLVRTQSTSSSPSHHADTPSTMRLRCGTPSHGNDLDRAASAAMPNPSAVQSTKCFTAWAEGP
jgi:hypothetical protein